MAYIGNGYDRWVVCSPYFHICLVEFLYRVLDIGVGIACQYNYGELISIIHAPSTPKTVDKLTKSIDKSIFQSFNQSINLSFFLFFKLNRSAK